MNGLIPTGSRAGVWTFGRYVNMAVKWDKVDDAWRRQADLGADKIHSIARSRGTDLKWRVDGLPAYSTPRDAFKVATELINRDTKISKNSFLRFIDFDITHIDAEELSATLKNIEQQEPRISQHLFEGFSRGGGTQLATVDAMKADQARGQRLKVQK